MLRSVLQNTFFQTFSKIFTSAVGFVITIIVARNFGSSGFGDYTKITSLVAPLYLVSDFGLNAIFLKEEKQDFKMLLTLRILISIILIAFLNLVLFILPYNPISGVGFSPFVRYGVLIFSWSILSYSVLTTSSVIFQKKLKFEFLMFSNILASASSLLIVFIFLGFSLTIIKVILSLVIGNFFGAILSLILTKENAFPIKIDFIHSREIFRKSLPLAFMLIFNLVYFRADIFILSLLKPSFDVGIYGLSYKFFDFLLALPLFLSNSLYPILLQNIKNYRNFFEITKNYLGLYIIISILIIIPFWFISPLFNLINKDFISAIIPFRILLLSLPIFFITSFFQWILISKNKQIFLMVIYLSSALLNIVLNVLFIPVASYNASAIITGVSEGFVLIFLIVKVLSLKKNFEI